MNRSGCTPLGILTMLNITYIDGNPGCVCHSNVDVPLVFNYIDGLVLPDAITISIFEKFALNRKILSYESLGITARLNISARKETTSVNISMNHSAYGIPLTRIGSSRSSFLSVIIQLLDQLIARVTASEAYAINQAIRLVVNWSARGDSLEEHDRLRELIGKAIDRAYRTTP